MESYFLLVCWFVGSHAQANSHIENQIVLQCLTDICEPEKEISEFLYQKKIFTFGDVWIVVQHKGQEIYRESLKKFIHQYWIKNEGNGAASARKVNFPSGDLSDVVSPADAALNCQYDMDYSCQDWQSSPYYGDYIIELDSYIRSVEIRFVVSQQYIDANNAAKNKMVAAALTVPIGRLGNFLLRYAEIYVPSFVAEAMIFTSLGTLISLPPSLEVGDMLVFRDGEVTVIKPGAHQLVIITRQMGIAVLELAVEVGHKTTMVPP